MTWDIILIIIGAVLIIAGIFGSILPFLPGIPLSYLGIIMLELTSKVNFSTQFLVAWAIIIIAVQILDYYIPIWGTRKFGGSSYGAWGSAIGMALGIFFYPPWGIILFPFFGAVIGELMRSQNMQIAFKAGFGTFIGFLTGTIMKLVVAFILAFYFFKEVFKLIL